VFEYLLGIIFGLLLASYCLSQMELPREKRPQPKRTGATKKGVAKTEGTTEGTTETKHQLKDPTAHSEKTARRFYLVNNKGIPETYSSAKMMSLRAQVRKLTGGDYGGLKAGKNRYRGFNIGYPEGWSLKLLNPGQILDIRNREQSIRIRVYHVLQNESTKAEVLRDYIKIIRSHSPSQALSLEPGKDIIPHSWDENYYEFSTIITVPKGKLHCHRAVHFERSRVFVITAWAWEETYQIWRELIHNITGSFESTADF
jgi:hypothetical protein